MKAYPPPSGFSRVDLLVVLSVLGLFLLVTPLIVGGSRQHGQSALCMDQMRRLTLAWLMYAADHEGYVPPNPDDGNTVTGHNWCIGIASPNTLSSEFNPDLLRRSMLFPYTDGDVTLFRCPADDRSGIYQGSDPELIGQRVPAGRSIAMNQAVGTLCALFPGFHQGAPRLRAHGPWLDNNHGHYRDWTFRTYGNLSDLVAPGPANTWLLIDEDLASINDGGFALGMLNAEWIDWPGARHDLGASISFTDGHAEIRRWVDSRTLVVGGNVSRFQVPGSEDYEWLRDRTSARIVP